MSADELVLRVSTGLTAARFLGDVQVTRDGDVLVVSGRRARPGLYRWRERVGGALLLVGAALFVLAATRRDVPEALVAFGLVLAASAVYVLGYAMLWWTSVEGETRFEQSAVQGLEIRVVRRFAWSTFGQRLRQLSFNVVDKRMRPTSYELLLEDDDELVRLAGLLARRDQPPGAQG